MSASLCVALCLAPSLRSEASAQGQSQQDVSEHVAAALYDRGMVLYEQGDIASAKKMFSESLERSGQGSRSADALRMLRSCNEKLGIGDLDAGRPTPNEGPLDPYANPAGGTDAPVDPYAEAGVGIGVEAPLDPYGTEGSGGVEANPAGVDDGSSTSRRAFLVYGGFYGFITGMAIGGPFQDTNEDGELDELSGGAVFAGLLGAGGMAYLSHYLSEELPLTATESAAVGSAGVWGMYNFAHWGNVFTGEDTDGNDIYKSMAIGGLVGNGLGYWYAKRYEPSEGQVALTNSFSLYGTSAGLLLGLAMDPPRGDAYSLNAALGSAAGLGTALYFGDEFDVTRRRMLKVDIGAAAGAALPWVVIYPLISASDGNSDVRLTGLLSAMSMGAGAYLAYYLTRDDGKDDEDESLGAPPPGTAPSPALMRRNEEGKWSLRTPLMRPMDLPALAPSRGLSLGVDLLSGRF